MEPFGWWLALWAILFFALLPVASLAQGKKDPSKVERVRTAAKKTTSLDDTTPPKTDKQIASSRASSSQTSSTPPSFWTTFWKQTSIIPVVLYSPETSAVFGAGTLTILDLDGANPDRPSSFSVFGMYTVNHQAAAVAAYELRGRGDRHILQQYFRFVDWPDQFYGIGNAENKGITVNDGEGGTRNYLKLTDRYLQLESEYQYQALSNLYIGFGHHWRSSDTPGIEDAADEYNFSAVRGVGKLMWSGLMPLVAYDTRDKLIWPSRGLFLRADAMVYRGFMGSDFDAELYRLDARWYTKLFDHQVLALRSVFQRASGDVPFQRLPALGGPDLFRGWYLGRLRDRALNCNQIESRHELGTKMAVIGFAALGRVAPRLSELDLDGYRVAGGAGFRYALNEKNRANLRLDIAYGAAFEFYFQFREAF